MKRLNGTITAATFAADEFGHEDRNRIALRFQPAPTVGERPDPDMVKRHVNVRDRDGNLIEQKPRMQPVETQRFSAISQTVDIGVIKVRYRKLSELCRQATVYAAEIDESGVIRSIDFAKVTK